jgi:putative tricarboxylic transport membrane protein
VSEGTEERRGLRGALIFGVVLLAFALYLLYDATRIRQGGGFTVVGPSVFPLVAAGALAILAVLMVLRATLWPDAELAAHGRAETRVTHWPTVGTVLVMLVVYPIAMSALGYVVATAIFVPSAAGALGSKKPGRDFAVGVGLALVIYLGFTRLLSVRLPAGILPF